MRITLLGLFTLVGVAVLLVYAWNKLRRTTQANAAQPPQDPDASINP